MLTDSIISVLTFLPNLLLSGFESVSLILEIPAQYYDGLKALTSCIGWLMPVKQLAPILYVSFSLSFAKIAWAIIIRMKSFVPTMGG